MLLPEAIHRSGLSELEFFQTAYLNITGKVYNCVNDTIQFRLHAIVPKYVTLYLEKMYK